MIKYYIITWCLLTPGYQWTELQTDKYGRTYYEHHTEQQALDCNHEKYFESKDKALDFMSGANAELDIRNVEIDSLKFEIDSVDYWSKIVVDTLWGYDSISCYDVDYYIYHDVKKR